MKTRSLVLAAALAAALPLAFAAPPAGAAETEAPPVPAPKAKIPFFSPAAGPTVVATVGEEAITVADLRRAIEEAHSGDSAAQEGGKLDVSAVLDRLVNVKLIAHEGTTMGLNELPEARKEIETYSAEYLRELLKRQAVRGVKPDPAVVTRLYRELVKEWKILSVKFEKKGDADALAKKLRAGKKFERLIAEAVAAKKAESSKEAAFVKPKDLLPNLQQAVAKLKAGAVSPVLPVEKGFVLLRLEGTRYPDDPEQKAVAERQALSVAQRKALQAYFDSLRSKYAQVDRKLLAKIDLEAKKPGLAALEKDTRPLVKIRGEAPVTVTDLVKAVEAKFYHGVESAREQHKINAEKETTLDKVLYERLFTKEAKAQGLHESEAYAKGVQNFQETLVFGLFLERVVKPDVKVTEAEAKAYYDEHVSEYSTPEMMRIKALAFEKAPDAAQAVEKLRQGTDFQWLKANAEGQVPADKKGLLTFDGSLIVLRSLPPEARAALTGAATGEFRLYAAADGIQYVLAVQEAIPPKPSPYEAERKGVAGKVFGLKLGQAVADWVAKLKEAYPVTRSDVEFEI